MLVSVVACFEFRIADTPTFTVRFESRFSSDKYYDQKKKQRLGNEHAFL